MFGDLAREEDNYLPFLTPPITLQTFEVPALIDDKKFGVRGRPKG